MYKYAHSSIVSGRRKKKTIERERRITQYPQMESCAAITITKLDSDLEKYPLHIVK